MSISYRKPWIKDPANSYMKKIHARKMRRITHQIMKSLIDYELGPEIPHYRSVSNQYDICDFCFWGSDPKYKRK